MFGEGMEHAGHLVMRPGQPLTNGFARSQQFLLKVGQRRRLTDERVGFLQEGNDANPHDGLSRLEDKGANQGHIVVNEPSPFIEAP